ncbi:MAG: tetratricopeptide repeat protein [Deltaproteobacteria bacterium]|nr:tetratricopeptide repeat protein [Deltaproteobacteria bacterium]
MVALLLLGVQPAIAATETRTIRATGEYRMGDNDTRADAKRLALLDAKRLALEQVGTCVESITEVRDMAVTRDEIRALTAGVVEIKEVETHATMDGETTVIRVDVLCRIDPGGVARQIARLRESEKAADALQRLHEENERLRAQLQEQSRQVAHAKTKTDVERATTKRQRVMQEAEADALIARAWAEIVQRDEARDAGRSPEATIRETRDLLQRAMMLQPDRPEGHEAMAQLLYDEGNFAGALRELAASARLRPDDWQPRAVLANALYNTRDLDGAIREYREALRLNPAGMPLRTCLGEALLEKKDFAGALRECSAEASTGWGPTRFCMGRALAGTGDFDGAERELRDVLRQYSAPNAHYQLGLVLMAKGNAGPATEQFKLYLRDLTVPLGMGSFGTAVAASCNGPDKFPACFKGGLFSVEASEADRQQTRDLLRTLGGEP